MTFAPIGRSRGRSSHDDLPERTITGRSVAFHAKVSERTAQRVISRMKRGRAAYSHPHVVYLIGTKNKTIVKIGYSGNILARFNSIKLGSPISLFLFDTIHFDSEEDARVIERELHEECKPYWKHGEWFYSGAVEAFNLAKERLSHRATPP